MRTGSLRQVLLACLVMSSVACSTTPTSRQSDSPEDLSAKVEQAGVTRLGNAPAGEPVVAPTSRLSHLDTVVVGEEYHAASGRICRRIDDTHGRSSGFIVCSTDSVWALNDALLGDSKNRFDASSSSRSLLLGDDRTATLTDKQPTARNVTSTVALETAPVVVSEPVNARGFQLLEGESLWSFAARVTDDPLHWEQIAAHNNIADVGSLSAGTYLDVPARLLE